MEKLAKSKATRGEFDLREDESRRFLRIVSVGRAVTDDLFYEAYGEFGCVNVALAPANHPKRFGYVEFKSSADAMRALRAVDDIPAHLVDESEVETIDSPSRLVYSPSPPPSMLAVKRIGGKRPRDVPLIDCGPEARDVRRLMVTGYDPSLPKKDIYDALFKYFSSCGDVMSVLIPTDPQNGGHHSVAILTMNGKRCLEKALKLSGHEVGGLNFSVYGEIPLIDPIRYEPVMFAPPLSQLRREIEERSTRN